MWKHKGFTILYLKNCMLLYMKTHYAELAINRTEDFIGVLKGWCNRK